MANFIISRTVDLGRAGNNTEFLSGSLFADENLAHTFAISATRNGSAIALSGVVTACFIRPDGGTVELDGTIEDGKACVTLAESCYVVTGRFKLTIFVSADGAKTAVYCAAGNVVETTTNTIIDPGSVVPSVDDIIAEYGTMQQAVEDCNTAKNNANSAAATAITAAINVAGAIADPYVAQSAYAVGDYCTRNAKLYRCITAIPTGGETWTESHWTEVQTMEEVGDLKSELRVSSDAVNMFDRTTITPGKYIGTNGNMYNASAASPTCVSAQIPVTPGTTIVFSHNLNSTSRCHVFQNANGNKLENGVFPSNADNMVKVVPEGAAFIRCTVYDPVVDDFKVIEKDAIENLKEGIQSVSDNVSAVEAEIKSIYDWQQNVFDKTTATDGKTIRISTKAVENNSATCLSDYVAVTPGDVVQINISQSSSVFGHGLYNASKTCEDVIPSNDNYLIFTIPDGIAYIRFTLPLASKDEFIARIITPVSNHINNVLKNAILTMADPERRHTIKSKGAALDGFTHCAFPSMCIFAGKEIIAYRASMSHYTPDDPANWGGVMLDTRDAEGNWTHLGLLDASSVSFNGELRDPKLSVSRDGKTLFLSCFTTYRKEEAPTVDVHDNVIFALNESLEITGGFVETEAQQVLWGNVLETPEGHLIVAAYEVDSNYGVKLYRSTAPYSGDISQVTFSATTLLDDGSGQEPTIGYLNDRYLICLIRIPRAGAKLTYTENLEGDSGWTTPKAPVGDVILHAPVLLPYWKGEYLPFSGAEYISETGYRKTVMGLIQFDPTNETNPAKWKIKEYVQPDMIYYSGYCGMTYLGGYEFDLVYYHESSSGYGVLNAQTDVWYKRVNLRMLAAAMAYV